MEFLINEALELLPFIGLAGTWSMNKPSPFSPFKKKPRQEGEEVFNPASSYGNTETVLGSGIETPEGQGTGIVTQNISSRLGNVIDTSNIDFGDEDQVKEIQRALGETEDGQWGPDTEKAYRKYISERRESQGLGQYMYDDLPVSKNDNNIGTLSDKVETKEVIPGIEVIPGMEEEIVDTTKVDSDTDKYLEENPGPPNKNKFWGPDKLWNFFGYE